MTTSLHNRSSTSSPRCGVNPEPALSEAMWSAIQSHATARVPLKVLQIAAASVDRTGAVSPGWRARISAALDSLRAQDRITFPKTRYDRSGNPPLPSYVQRPRATNVRSEPPKAPVWHAEMAWATRLFDRLAPAEQHFVVAVNAWLSKRRGIAVPLRERSLEIFGDEKLLERRVTSPLFAPGRLSLEMLETFLCWPPVEQSGTGPGNWLIVENYTTYHSLAARAREAGFDGRIIWGSGNGVGTRLAALAINPPYPVRLYYFGDIDAGGFRIARSAVARAAEHGLPAVHAAGGLYRLLMEHGMARDDTKARTPDPLLQEWTAEWLGEPAGSAAAAVLGRKQRIVQEAVGSELLSRNAIADWF